QNTVLEMIPSENLVSLAVLEAMGSVLTNKYSEGYPGKRYYGGNQFIDMIESLAIERAKKLFGAEHANVQAESGSPANFAAYNAVMAPGDTLMGLQLDHGGHLTHGHTVSVTSKYFRSVPYHVDPETQLIDFDELRKIAYEAKPKVIVSGATAYPRAYDYKKFHEIAEEVGAYSMADIAHVAGLIVGGVHPSPFPFTDIVTSTTHKTLRGPRSGLILSRVEDRLRSKYRPDSRLTLAQLIDKSIFPGLQGGPHEHIIAGKAVCFLEAAKPSFKDYSAQIVRNAKALASELLNRGFTLVTGGTDNHLVLVDLTNKNVTGKQAEGALDESGITVNKNAIPFDKRKPFDPSGIRVGTPALTTRGMKENEMKLIGELIDNVVSNHENNNVKNQVREKVFELCKQFPVYPELA
ncbi:serine hydroxymethyltransferase, partial [archaeon]|nr:serine hydroxymethyltransferase [archaeon]